MKVIVTGGAGFIGSHIVDKFTEEGHDVWVLDDFSSGSDKNLENSNAKVITHDIVSGNLETIPNDFPDVIIHEAAQPSLLKSVQHPILDATINILGTINVIEAARRCGAYVIMASTSAVYDDTDVMPYKENGQLRPTRPYGIAKMAAECYLRESGVGYTILRYGNVYGPRQVPVGENQLIPHVLNRIYHNAPFVVNGDGEQKRDFIYVKDVADANYLAAVIRKPGTYNIANGFSHSVNSVLETLRDLTNWNGEFQYGPGKPKEPRDVALDTLQAYLNLQWSAETSLAQGLAQTVQWYEEQMKGDEQP